MKVFILVLIIFGVGCEIKSNDSKGGDVSKMSTYKHEGGLVVKITESLGAVLETERGFKVTLSKSSSRLVNTMRIEVYEQIPFQPEHHNKVDGVEYGYLKELYEGGSGGAEYTMRIWKAVGKTRGIYFEHYQQSDRDVSFDEIWNIAANSFISDE